MMDLETFIHDIGTETIFRLYKYRKLFTPFEQDKKYTDETVFENGGYPEYVRIVNAIELPDGDVLLQLLEDIPISERDDDYGKQKNVYLYEKLSDIKLEEWESDNIEYSDENDEY